MAIKNLKWDHPLLHDLYDTYITSVVSHVGIQGNERVDALVKLALNEPCTNIKIPYTDLIYYAKFYLRIKW